MTYQDDTETVEDRAIARANLEADMAKLEESGEGFEPLY
jgi:hypothetical protein